MKKIEETKKSIAAFYTDLLTLLRGDSDKTTIVFNTEDFKKTLKELDDTYGIVSTRYNRYLTTLETFKRFFSKYIISEIIDDTWKGKGKRKTYTLEIKPEDLTGLELRLKKEFAAANRGLQERLFGKTIAKEEKVEPKITKVRRLKASFIKKFFNMLVLAYYGEGKLNMKEIKVALGHKSKISPNALINSWKRSLSRVSIIPFKAVYVKHTNVIEFYELKNLLMCIDRKHKEWFGEELGAKDVLKISPKAVVVEKDAKTFTTVSENITDSRDNGSRLLPFDISISIYTIAGLCIEGTASFERIHECLKSNHSIILSKTEIIKLVKTYANSYLEVSTGSKEGIYLNKNINWTEFKKEFSPENYKSSVIARIGESEEILRRLNLSHIEFEVLSVISSSDAIYRINYSESKLSFRDLCRLCRTFRGIDEIFDEKLTERIAIMNSKIDSGAFIGDTGYAIEIEIGSKK